MRVKLGATVAALALVLSVQACGGDDGGDESNGDSEPVSGRFVGQVPDADAFIAVVSSGDYAVAYLCDGKRNGERFEGPVRNNEATLTGDEDGRLEAALTTDSVTGTVTQAGAEQLDFEAEPARGRAGYYRAEGRSNGEPVVAGWVVLANGEQKGTQSRPSASSGGQRQERSPSRSDSRAPDLRQPPPEEGEVGLAEPPNFEGVQLINPALVAGLLEQK